MIVASPAQCIKPPRQAKPGRSIIRKFCETIALTDKKGRVIGMKTFGASAPLKDLQKKFGFTTDAVIQAARDQLGK